MAENKRSNKYFDWLIYEAQKRHSGETFTLSHDRARLVPSYASIDPQQEQSANSLPLPQNPSISVSQTAAAPKVQSSHDKEWAQALALTFGDVTHSKHAGKMNQPCTSPRRLSSSSNKKKKRRSSFHSFSWVRFKKL